MFATTSEESHEDRIKAAFRAKAKMFLYTIAITKIIGLAVQYLSANEDKEQHFCSVACYKQHSCSGLQSNAAGGASPTASTPAALGTGGKEADLSEPQITALKEDQKLRSMLSNNVLRRVLRQIAASSDPASAIAPYMRDEFFAGFVTQVLETLDAVHEPAADGPSALDKP
ncbi:hypothetical protein, conserved [Babesia bigemina]|uniref:Uncharacterized protein n=1 Tax=Babesia bigemina TaxID=5866 RepID=A0A061DCF7_BABBI|nr:hypothetical protein, conserved [Babesia bigemina]CDR95530.1 hypothetical protein, conserved [Babesia bigemina]|eukprot:XP_012767716.1 hypothetical protein, conserved [Babesia bigemina]